MFEQHKSKSKRHSHTTELTSSSLTTWGRMCGHIIGPLFCAWEDGVRVEYGSKTHSGCQWGIDCTSKYDMFWNSSSHAFLCRTQKPLDLVTTPDPHLLLVHHLHLKSEMSSHPDTGFIGTIPPSFSNTIAPFFFSTIPHFFSSAILPFSLAQYPFTTTLISPPLHLSASPPLHPSPKSHHSPCISSKTINPSNGMTSRSL